MYDALLRETLSSTLNVNLNDDRWLQASLPVRWGGIGVREAVLLAPSAFLASAAGSSKLVLRLLPTRIHASTEPYFNDAMSA